MTREDNQRVTGSIIVGLDVHKDTIAACVFNASTGEILHEQQLNNQQAAVAATAGVEGAPPAPVLPSPSEELETVDF